MRKQYIAYIISFIFLFASLSHSITAAEMPKTTANKAELLQFQRLDQKKVDHMTAGDPDMTGIGIRIIGTFIVGGVLVIALLLSL